MRKINLAVVLETERKSPKGKFQRYIKEVSIALGREPDSTDLLKRHPFDLAVVRIPPGKSLCPYHSHSAQWEMYVVISGTGTVRDEKGMTEVKPGDVFLFGPNEAHEILNRGQEEFVYYIIADNPFGTTCHYPDSKKWAVTQPAERTVLKGAVADYWDGEE
jgi:uncharacterized cupin superfamily protein